MQTKNKTEQSIQEIRDIMERSTTFVSLSGLSGIIAGVLSLSVVAFLYSIFGSLFVSEDMLNQMMLIEDNQVIIYAIFITLFILSLLISFILSYMIAHKKNQRIFNSSSKHFALNLFIPIITAIFIIPVLINRGYFWLLAPVTLIFFGISLISASKYSRREVTDLGLGCILSGIIALYYVEFSLLLWGIGFGILNILTGITMYYKYDRKK